MSARAWLLLLPLALAPMSALAKKAAPAMRKADATTQALLKPPSVLEAVMSPDGGSVAIARTTDKGTVVTVVRWPDEKLVRTVQPGNVGAIETVRWLDDARLLISTEGKVSFDETGITIAMPTTFIVPVGGAKPSQMPANFVATIEGDPGHLLVSNCPGRGDCVLEIRKVATTPDAGPGEVVMKAPASYAIVLSDDRGNVRFAMGWAKDGRSKTWVNSADRKSWTVINDEATTGLSVYPAGVTADGTAGFLQSQRADGTDVIERYDFATGRRSDVMRDPGSDALQWILATDTKEPLGAWFGQTSPQAKFWNPTHPQAILVQEAQAAFPGKYVRVTSASRDHRRAILFVSDEREPGRFYVYDRDSRTPSLVAASRAWLDPAKMAPGREVALTARDGLPLKGILTTPPGAAAGRLPMVVLVHGGPYEMADAWEFSDEVQILAQQGFAVLQVNFRGSGGYGKPFVDKGMRQWGRAMQDDVTDATRWAIAQGIADPARVCIYGASYGAYAALMGAAREPDLYRCAAGYAGIYDLKKMYKWDNLRRSDLGMEYLHRAIGRDDAELAASSPMLQAARIKANVFLAHGAVDQISDIRFARAMQKALNKTRAEKVDLVVYERQGHGLLDSTQREDFYARLLAFLHANLDAPAAQAAAPTAAAAVAVDAR